MRPSRPSVVTTSGKDTELVDSIKRKGLVMKVTPPERPRWLARSVGYTAASLSNYVSIHEYRGLADAPQRHCGLYLNYWFWIKANN